MTNIPAGAPTKTKAIVKIRMDKLLAKPKGILGYIGDVAGNIFPSASEDGLVFVRVRGQVGRAYRGTCPPIWNLPVELTYDIRRPDLYRITEYFVPPDFNVNPATQVSGHHEIHEFLNPNGGTDVVWVQLRQWMPFRVSAAGGMEIAIGRAITFREGDFKLVEPESLYDLTSYRPTTSPEALYLLVYEDETGAITFLAGDTVSTVADLTIADIPTPPPRSRPLAAVRLFADQTEIREDRTVTDILDPRFPETWFGTPQRVPFFSDDFTLTESDKFLWDEANKFLILRGNVQQIIYDDSLFPEILTIRGRGTEASPAALQANDILFRLGNRGRAATALSSGNRARYESKAAENWSDTVQGTVHEWYATLVGTVVTGLRMALQGSGLLQLFGVAAGLEVPLVASVATPATDRLVVFAAADAEGNPVLKTEDADGNVQIKASLAASLKISSFRG